MTLQNLYTELKGMLSSQQKLVLSLTTPGLDNFYPILQALKLKSITFEMLPSDLIYDAAAETITLSKAGIPLFGKTGSGQMIIKGPDTTQATYDLTGNIPDLALQDFMNAGIFSVSTLVSNLLPTGGFPNTVLSASSWPKKVNHPELAAITFSATQSSKQIALLASIGLTLNNLGYTLQLQTLSSTSMISGSVSLTGDWMLGSTVIPISVGFPTVTWSRIPTWSVGISKPFPLLKGLSDLVQLLSGFNLFDALPQGFSVLSDFSLSQLTIQFDPTKATIYSMKVTVQSTSSWTTAGGYFTITKVALQVNYINQGSTGLWQLALMGDFQFMRNDPKSAVSVQLMVSPGRGDWELFLTSSLSIPSFSDVSNISLPGTPAVIQQLVNSLSVPGELIQAPAITVRSLSITYNPNSGSIPSCSTELRFEQPLVIFQGVLSISEANLILEFSNTINQSRSVTGKVSGYIAIGNYSIQVEVQKSEGPGNWYLSGKLLSPIQLSAVANQLLKPFNISVPAFVGDPSIQNLGASIDLSTKSYSFHAEIKDWTVDLGLGANNPTFAATSDIQYNALTKSYDGSYISGSVTLPLVQFPCTVSYFFQTGNNILSVEWNGFKGSYETGTKTFHIQCGELSLGYMMEYLVGLVSPNPWHLPPPWDALNSINLNGFILNIDLSNNTVGLSYTLDRPLELLFVTVRGVTLSTAMGKSPKGVIFQLDGTFFGNNKGLNWDLVNEAPPKVPNQGAGIFDLSYLGLGQHISLADTSQIFSVESANTAFMQAFKSPASPDQSPISGNAAMVFNPDSNWMFGTEFKLFDTIGLSVIFNDPALYGLLLTVSGGKIPSLSGLRFEVLYKKINESVGMYKAEITLPERFRRIELGAVSLTLPVLGVEIYTNGDFMVDLGFPYNGDFSRSATVQLFPFLGSGGMYFAKLSKDTARNVPTTTKGVFDPVMQFGLGVEVGIGKDFNLGILHARISLTMQGMLEGVVANYTSQGLSPEVTETYYWLRGTLALVGEISGSVDFKIAQAGVSLTARSSVTGVLEPYRAFNVELRAQVSASVQVRVNLGLFSITIGKSFSAGIAESFTIGSDSTAPWQVAPLASPYNALASRYQPQSYIPLAQQLSLRASDIQLQPFSIQPFTAATKIRVNLLFAPQIAVTGALNGNAANSKAWYDLLFYVPMEPGTNGKSEFDNLATGVFSWLLNSGQIGTATDPTHVMDFKTLAAGALNIKQLDDTYTNLALYQGQENGLINYTNLQQLFTNALELNLSPVDTKGGKIVTAGLFPLIPSMTLGTTDGQAVDFSQTGMCGQPYFDSIVAYFRELSPQTVPGNAAVCAPGPTPPPLSPAPPTQQSISTFLFEDYFTMLGKGVLTSAIRLLHRWPWTYQSSGTQNTITLILAYVNQITAGGMANGVSIPQFADANADIPFSPGLKLGIEGVYASVRTGQPLGMIAGQYGLTAGDLANANGSHHNLLRPGIKVTLNKQEYLIRSGETLLELAAESKIQIVALGNALANVTDLLLPNAELMIPRFEHTVSTTVAETLATVALLYALDPAVLAQSNSTLTGIFKDGTLLTLPGLNAMYTQDMLDTLVLHGNLPLIAEQCSANMLAGLRLPVDANIQPPKGCASSPNCALYDLTGQQFPLPGLKPGDPYVLTLTRSGTAPWLLLDGNPNLSTVSVPLDAKDVNAINALLQTTLDPKLVELGPKVPYLDENIHFSLLGAQPWQSAGGLTLPVGTPNTADARPFSLWSLPMRLLEKLETQTGSPPVMQVQARTQRQAGGPVTTGAVGYYGMGTTVKLKVRKIAAAGINTAYEIVGADPIGTAYLEKLTALIASGAADPIDNIYFLFPSDPSAGASTALQSGDPARLKVYLTQTNLSTESNPPLGGMTSPTASNYILNPLPDFVRLLWQASIVRSGGYYLNYLDEVTGTGIPESLFLGGNTAEFVVAIVFKDQGGNLYPWMNSIAIGDPVDPRITDVFLESTQTPAAPDPWHNRIPVLPLGCVSMRMVRTNPGDPALSTAAFLANAYYMTGYEILPNTDFSGSNPGLPMPPVSTAATDPFTGTWVYERVIPVYRFAKAKRMPAVPNMPQPDGNPYAAVGKTMAVKVTMRDNFGNEVPVPTAGTTFTDTVQIKSGYIDQLLPISGWPGMSLEYTVELQNGAPTLTLYPSFDAAPYGGTTPAAQAKENACLAWESYQKIYYQIVQDDVTMEWRTSMTTPNAYPQDKAAFETIIGKIYQFLASAKAGTATTAPTFSPIQIPLKFNNTQPVFQLTVELAVRRDPTLVEAGFANVEGVAAAISVIRPHLIKPSQPATASYPSLREFAKSFEASFQSAGQGTKKIGTGQSHKTLNRYQNPENIWVIQIGPNDLAITIQPDVFWSYAIPPVSNQLESRSDVAIPTYQTGKGLDLQNTILNTYSGVDQDGWARNFLQVFDQFFQPRLAVPAQLADFLGGTTHYADLLKAKESLAAKISAHATTILTAPASTTQEAALAQEKFRQELLRELSRAYTITSVIQYHVAVNSPYSTADATIPPNFYGQPAGQNAPVGTDQFSLSPVRIPLVKEGTQLSSVFITKETRERALFSMNMDFTLSYLETEIEQVPNIPGYTASTWLSFVIPFQPTSIGKLDVPLVLRGYPTPPNLSFQTASPTGNGADLKAWTYRYGFTKNNAAQDQLLTQIEFNLPANSLRSFRPVAVFEDFFASLAAFSSLYQAIQADLDLYLPQLTAQTTTSDATYLNATAAVQALLDLVQAVEKTWPAPAQGANTAQPKSNEYHQYEMIESALADGSLQVRFFPITWHGHAIAIPVPEIPGYTTIQDPKDNWLSTFVKTGTQQKLSYLESLQIPERAVSVSNLDVLILNNGWAEVLQLRNAKLNPSVATNPKFIYQTPWIGYPNSIVPDMDIKTPTDVGKIGNPTGPRPLQTIIEAMFGSIFSPSQTWNPQIRMDLRFGQTVNPDGKLGELRLPVSFLPLTLIQITSGKSPVFDALTAEMKAWFQKSAPKGFQQQFWMDLVVYATAGDSVPLLRYWNLFLKVGDISDL